MKQKSACSKTCERCDEGREGARGRGGLASPEMEATLITPHTVDGMGWGATMVPESLEDEKWSASASLYLLRHLDDGMRATLESCKRSVVQGRDSWQESPSDAIRAQSSDVFMHSPSRTQNRAKPSQLIFGSAPCLRLLSARFLLLYVLRSFSYLGF